MALFGKSAAPSLSRWREFDPEVVLGVAAGALPHESGTASILQREFTSMVVTRKDEGEEPVLIAGPPSTIRGRRVLIVDETCDTGSTMKLALAEVRAARPMAVQTAVSFRTGVYLPDFHGFETPSFIILPWDREIIVNGELVIRPDYVGKPEGRRIGLVCLRPG